MGAIAAKEYLEKVFMQLNVVYPKTTILRKSY